MTDSIQKQKCNLIMKMLMKTLMAVDFIESHCTYNQSDSLKNFSYNNSPSWSCEASLKALDRRHD